MQTIPNESPAKSGWLPSLSPPFAIRLARKIDAAAALRVAVLIAAGASMAMVSAIPARAAAPTKTVEIVEDAVIDPMSADPARPFADQGFLVKTHWGYDAEGKEGKPDRFTKRAKRIVRKMLKRVDASPEQKERIDAIVDRSLNDIHLLRADFHKSRRAFLAVLAQESPDEAALSDIRSEMLNLDSEINTRILDAMIDISKELTPDQRRMVISKFSGRRGFFGRLWKWHDRHHQGHHDHYDESQ